MKIIQSFWTKPFFTKEQDDWEGRKMGGWQHRKYFYMSWALSCLQFKKYYEKVELITDIKGKEILIELLGLPYTDTNIILDTLNHYHEDLWAIGKIFSYSIQNEPFIHADNDVFIWEKFSNSVLQSDLIAQNIEIDFHYDRLVLSQILEHFKHIPEPISKYASDEIISSNAGVIGGNNFTFFQKYAQKSLEFINANLDNLQYINIGLSNIIFEQFMFTCMARTNNLSIQYILHDIDNLYQKYLCDFQGVSHRTKYIHIIGPYKKDVASENWLEERLLFEYPAYYYKILALINEGVI